MLTESGEADMPRADRDLRETFSADLLMGEDEPVSRGKPRPSGSSDMADAAGLFKDDAPPRREGKNLAEARSRPRRCPDCGTVVAAGMSLCQRCGLDLDTGTRPMMEELLEEAPIAARPKQAAPIGILVLGGVVAVASVVLTLLALVQSMQPQGEGAGLLSRQKGFLSLAFVGAFCIYASVQFLRGRSMKLLVIALMLGALLDLIGLIGLPVYEAFNSAVPVEIQRVGLDDEELPEIRNVSREVDTRLVTWGIALLLCDGAAMVYLLSPPVRRHFERQAFTPPIGVM